MKLRQKTIFQCFDKPKEESTIIVYDTDDDIVECEIKSHAADVHEETHRHESDFLIPVHIRQECKSVAKDSVPLLGSWHLDESDESSSSYHYENFYRICPNVNSNEIDTFKFIHVPSVQRQIELFQLYTNTELTCDLHTKIDWQTMFDCLKDSRQKAIEQNQYEQLLWTDVYRPRNFKTYLSNHTKPIRRLNQWFLHWGKKLRNEPSKENRQKGRKRRRDYEDNSDEDFIVESNMIYHDRYQVKQDHPQIIFIHGCGTTCLVHALAEEHNFKITEINSSQSRSRQSLIKQLQQVTSHHHLTLKRCSSDTIISKEERLTSNVILPAKKKTKRERGTITSFFSSKKNDHKDETSSVNDSRSRSKSNKKVKNQTVKQNNATIESDQKSTNPIDNGFLSNVHVEKTSLILFDEIETVTIEDNFWSCLKKILETAKKPIVLTSNSRSNPADALENLSKICNYEMIHLEPIEPNLIYCFLRLILLVEMIEIQSFENLISLVQSCSYDLRRSLLALQFHIQSSRDDSSSTRDSLTNSNNSKLNLQSSRVFDAMFYSNLREQWDESILKTYFDDLTLRHTSEYEQSYSILTNRDQNKSQRVELYNTLKDFLQEQEIESDIDRSAFYLDYRPYIRQICQNEQIRATESNSRRRLRHCLGFRGCSMQWSDFGILSTGLD